MFCGSMLQTRLTCEVFQEYPSRMNSRQYSSQAARQHFFLAVKPRPAHGGNRGACGYANALFTDIHRNQIFVSCIRNQVDRRCAVLVRGVPTLIAWPRKQDILAGDAEPA